MVSIPLERITLFSFGYNIWGGLLVHIDDTVGSDVGVQWTMVEVIMMLLVKLVELEVERWRGGEVEREGAPFQSDMSAPALVFPDSVNTSVGSQGR